MVPARLLHLFLDTHYKVFRVELGGARVRKSKSMLCCVWMMMPLIPNIMSKFF